MAASGAVLLVHTDLGLRFGGYQTAACLDHASAPRAEAFAVLLAVQWAHSLVWHGPHHHVPFHFYFDSMYAGNLAQGLCASTLNDNVLIIVRSLVLWLEQLSLHPLAWSHVKGHSDHPWNDLVDAVSARAVRSEVYTHDLTNHLAFSTFDGRDLHSVQWLWLYERSLQGQADAPVLQGFHWKFNTAAPVHASPDGSVQPWMRRQSEVPALSAQDAPLTLRVATANVLTLYPAQERAATFLGARAEHLAMLFHHAGVHCAGIQETRCRQAGHVDFDRFHVLSSSATCQGHGGMQLWIAKRLQDSAGHSLLITAEHLRIIHGDDRRLLVQLRHDHLRLLFVVLHAPCHDRETDLDAWWKVTSAHIPSSFSSWTWIVLCDANSRLGSIESDSVGCHGLEEENNKGACFHSWLLRHNLWLPQTFESSHHGDHFTWTHASQGQGRIDYIGVSTNIGRDQACTWIDKNVDLSIVRPDHECVCADIVLSLDARPSTASKSAIPALGRPPRWHDDVHTHAALLQMQIAASIQPSPRACLRKCHLTDETFELIRRKRRQLKRLQQAKSTWRLYCLKRIFDGFRYPDHVQSDDRASVVEMYRSIALCEERYRVASLQVCLAVRRDDQTFYSDLAEDTGRLAQQGFHRIWDAIKPLLPKWKNRRKHNLRCVGPTPDQQAVHYCALEDGQQTSYAQLLTECHSHQASQQEDMPLVVHLQQLPTRLDIERCIQRISANKAPGVDGIRPAVIRTEGPLLSDQLCHLIVKMWLTGHEPLQFKGGLLHSISKKVHSTQVEHMRGIMLIDVIGKVAHSLLRNRFLPILQQWKHPLQLGGFPNCTTTFATHYLRLFQDRARALSMSSAVVFLDVKAAFHSMVRQLLFGGSSTLPEALCQVLRAAGCDPAVVANEIVRTSSTFLADVPFCERRLLQDAHSCTWFGLTGCPDTYQTFRGSRPGSPLADVAFNGMMVQVLSDLQDALLQIPLVQVGLSRFELPAPPVTWVDDVAIPVVTTQSSELEPAIAQVVDTTVSVFKRHGLILNFNSHKTETVVTFRGSEAPACRHSLFVERLGCLPLRNLDSHIRCVASYEHLGTLFADDQSLAAEIAHRKKKAIHAHRQVSRGILHNRHVDVVTRLKLFESLVIPVLLHGAGNWGLLSKRSFAGLHARIMTWQRSIINNGFWTPGQHSDFALQCHWKLPPLALRLAKLRLLYAFHCVRDGPHLLIEYLTAAASYKGSWFQAVRIALIWLSSMNPTFCPPSLAKDSVEVIQQWFSDHSTVGPRQVKRLYKKALMQYHVLGDATQLHKQLKDVMQEGGVHFSEAAPVCVSGETPFDCEWCERQFDTFQKLQVHLWNAHQIISDERRFVFSSTCLACNQCLWTAARLQQHLRLSRKVPDGCYARMTWRYAPLQDAQVIDLPDDLRDHARLPAVSVATVAATPVECSIATRADADRLLCQAWADADLPEVLDPVLQVEVAGFADEVLLRWQPAPCIVTDDIVYQIATYVDSDDAKLWAFCVWVDTQLCYQRFSHLPPPAFQCMKRDLQALCMSTPVGRLLAWQWRMDRAYIPLEVVDADRHFLSSFEHEYVLDPVELQTHCFDSILQSVLEIPDCSKIPITYEDGQPVIWVLHLFSGRRRRGDCHFWFESLKHLLPGYEVRVLSVDTAIDARLGNLDRGVVFSRLLRMIQKKFFASGLTGPPCETFSAARHVILEDERHPRPLRSQSHPWLIAHRTTRELYQVMIGSRLLLHSLILETALVLSGGASGVRPVIASGYFVFQEHTSTILSSGSSAAKELNRLLYGRSTWVLWSSLTRLCIHMKIRWLYDR
eukprot:s1432_g9.t1